MTGIALRGMPGVTRPVAEGRPEDPGHEPPHYGRRALVLSGRLPRDALIELVIRCRLGLRVELALPGISHLPQRRAASRREARG